MGYFAFLHPWLSSFLPEPAEYSDWIRWLIYPLRYLFHLSMIILGLMITLLTITAVYFTVSAPFFDKMTLIIEKESYNFEEKKLDTKEAAKYLGVSIYNSALLNLQALFWGIVLFPLSFFVPYVGTVIYTLVVGYFFGLPFLMYSAEHRLMGRKDFKACLKGRRMLVLGFGTAAYFLLLVPLLAIPLLPIAVAGGAILFNEEIDNLKKLPE